MQNTYQDLITEIQNKNPGISPKLEGGKKFQMKTDFKPAGDQPCLLYTSPSPRDMRRSRMPSSA